MHRRMAYNHHYVFRYPLTVFMLQSLVMFERNERYRVRHVHFPFA